MTAKEKLSRSQDLAQKVALVYSKRTQIAREQFSKSVAGAVEANTPTAGDTCRRRPAVDRLPTPTRSTRAQRASPLLGHAAPARQRLRRAHEGRAAAGAAFRLRDRGRRPQLAAPGQLRAGAHHAAGGRHDRSDAAALRRSSIRARATARASAASRTTRRSAWRLRDGHPVYFVIFFRDPEPGQTLLDVCEAEQEFVQQGARAAPEQPEARHRRQLPGRLGGDDARRLRSRRHRARS